MDDLSKAYQVLGLQAGDSPEAARQAYRDLVNVWHPDRFGHDERLRAIAQEKLKEINGAYEVVKASFFDTGLAAMPSGLGEPAVAADASPAEPTGTVRRGAIAWAVLGGVGFAVLATAVFLSVSRPRGAAPRAVGGISSGQPRFALICNPGGRVEIFTTGSLAGTFTVEGWASTRRPKGTGTILSSRGPKDFGFDIKFREGKRFHGDIGDGSRWLARMANARFNYNRGLWYHVAYVVTPTNYSIYVNGVPTDDGQIYPPGQPLLYDEEHRLCLGADMLEPADLDGSVAELRIWRTARTAEQIKANLHGLADRREPGLQGIWSFAEGTGTETKDGSGHGFTAKLIGSVEWTTNTPPAASH